MRPLRYVAALSACLAAVALATSGCGGNSSSSSDLGSVLAYIPADTPFALELDTDLGDSQ